MTDHDLLAVAGGKGGCGKTTVTLGLAAAAGRDGASVLAVDADAGMPDLHRVAGVDRTPGVDAGPPDAVARPAAPTGVAVAPAPTGDGDRTAALSRCRGVREFALLDCPAGAGPDAAAPLRAADATLLVTTPTAACLRDAARTAAMAWTLDAPPVGVVVTRAAEAPAGLSRLLDADPLAAVPTAAEPLADADARAAYRTAWRALAADPAGHPIGGL